MPYIYKEYKRNILINDTETKRSVIQLIFKEAAIPKKLAGGVVIGGGFGCLLTVDAHVCVRGRG